MLSYIVLSLPSLLPLFREKKMDRCIRAVYACVSERNEYYARNYPVPFLSYPYASVYHVKRRSGTQGEQRDAFLFSFSLVFTSWEEISALNSIRDFPIRLSEGPIFLDQCFTRPHENFPVLFIRRVNFIYHETARSVRETRWNDKIKGKIKKGHSIDYLFFIPRRLKFVRPFPSKIDVAYWNSFVLIGNIDRPVHGKSDNLNRKSSSQLAEK